MRALRVYPRTLILCFLCVSFLIPIFLLSHRLKHIKSDVSHGLVEDLSIIKHRTEAQTLSAIKQELLLVYKDDASNFAVNISSTENTRFSEVGDGENATRNDTVKVSQNKHPERELSASRQKEKSRRGMVQNDRVVQTKSRPLDEKVKEMKDLVIKGKVYLTFTPVNSSSHLVKELKIRIKEVERALSQSIKDSRVSRGSLQKMKAMETTLSKASRLYPDCSAMIKKLRAMTYNAEEQVRLQMNQENFLRALGGRTIPKGLHCLSMRLTDEYFSLEPEERRHPYMHKLEDPRLLHLAVFSDNVLACAVVVNSTVSTAEEPGRLVFHIVTDTLSFPAISMWFLLNPPGKATINVESIENFVWLTAKHKTTLQREGSIDPRYASELNYLRFYLPDVFPNLSKIVLLDHDVVVKKDITRLWDINMSGKVNGAVLTCDEREPSFRRMDMLVNFTDLFVAKKFDPNTCTWAFGVNLFDLQSWRQQNITGLYRKYFHLGNQRPLWKSGSLPIGWVTFYGQTFALDKSWHVLGLGHDSGVRQENIDDAAILHYDGILKPWLDIGIEKYKPHWRKYVKYEHPYLQQCNVHD